MWERLAKLWNTTQEELKEIGENVKSWAGDIPDVAAEVYQGTKKVLKPAGKEFGQIGGNVKDWANLAPGAFAEVVDGAQSAAKQAALYVAKTTIDRLEPKEEPAPAKEDGVTDTASSDEAASEAVSTDNSCPVSSKVLQEPRFESANTSTASGDLQLEVRLRSVNGKPVDMVLSTEGASCTV